MRHGSLAAVVAAMIVASTPVHASPWSVPSTLHATAPAPAEPTTVGEASETGDLTTARTLAAEAREADPSAATWLAEAEVLEQSGEYAAAAKAYRAAAKAAGKDEDARLRAEDGLARVQAAGRGTVADEPASTHRKQLDQRWAPKPKPKPEPKPEPVVDEPPPDRIVTKWYFWVTVGAIAASAAAVTAIAIRAARDDQPDALSLTPAPPPRGLGVLRF